MTPDYADVMVAAGRFLLGGLFVADGSRHFFIAPAVTEAIRARGMPFPGAVLYIGTVFQIACGLLLMFGLFVVPAALGLVAFTLAASVMLLNYWDMTGPGRQTAINTWLSNIAIVGGLLIAAARGL